MLQGAGKALLYPLSPDELVDVIVKTGLQRFTPTTIVDLPVLQRNLDEARARGYSIDQEEHVTGLNCIASAVYDDVGSVVAAISISGPASRLTPDRFVSQGELVRGDGKEYQHRAGTKTSGRVIAEPTRSEEREFLGFIQVWKNFPI
ncbi:Negative regulator of allantoin and glyoxylate utilization operons [Raoultella planticola]|uniref:Negative regulator of allantoin and glyoxylate utilization operons n=1 Tax=Raoultella planticola TaxID=575 RepID=A0A485DCA1_RAOPL|nr:Negative regulator of allantoin and glyoxylate utilization operons [Raoultella planticola]